MKEEEVHELLYQALETELGGVQVYQTAVRCAVNDDLKQEWEEYLEQTQNHVRIVETVFARLELDRHGRHLRPRALRRGRGTGAARDPSR